jgi:hypothetical protein
MELNYSREEIYWIRGYLSGDGHALGRMASARGARQPPEEYQKRAEQLKKSGVTLQDFDEMIKKYNKLTPDLGVF